MRNNDSMKNAEEAMRRKDAHGSLTEKLHRPPTKREFAEVVGVSVNKISQFAEYHHLPTTRSNGPGRSRESYDRILTERTAAHEALRCRLNRAPSVHELAEEWGVDSGTVWVYVGHIKRTKGRVLEVTDMRVVRREQGKRQITEIVRGLADGETVSRALLAEMLKAQLGFVDSLVRELRDEGAAIPISMGGGRGARNGRWNGGSFQYPNHPEMKRQRIKAFTRTKGRCEICGETARHIHHIDEDKSNHILDNLLVVCTNCHGAIHSGENSSHRGPHGTSKYKRLYGYSIKEMATIIGCSTAWIYSRMKTGKADEVIALVEQARDAGEPA